MSLSEDMGGIWSDSKRRCEIVSRQRQQQSIIREIEAIEACVYCYIDSRLQSSFCITQGKSILGTQTVTFSHTSGIISTISLKVVIIASKGNSRFISPVPSWTKYITKLHTGVSVRFHHQKVQT